MNDNWRLWLNRATRYGLVSEDSYDVIKEWRFRDRNYPLTINKDNYRASNIYQKTIAKKKWGHFHGVTTGSSGEPFTAVIDLKTRILRGLHWRKQMQDICESSKLVLMWRDKSPSWNQKRLIAADRLTLLPIYDMTGEKSSFISKEKVKAMLASLPRDREYTFRSYVSVLKYLAQEFKDELRRLSIFRVVASGETLTPSDWTLIEDGFGCVCINVYGGTEASPIAISSENDRRLKIQEELFHVGVSERFGHKNIIVTDKINTVCPIFAYEIGDYTDGIDEEPNGAYLKNVIGRVSEIVKNRKGEMISSHFVHIVFRDECEVRKYRVYATDSGSVTLSIETFYNANENAIESRIRMKFEGLGFNVETVKFERIPLLAGLKHRTIIRV
jgi:phenylacetate-coenzyme A ligase PaaK-like adenylate-forming protein